ncbi:MAG: FtsX-like permease family protein [Steroidobacteraceae bacterium]
MTDRASQADRPGWVHQRGKIKKCRGCATIGFPGPPTPIPTGSSQGAAVNSCYAAVDARRREIGTLRAIGFGMPSIATPIVVEGVLISLLGACLGSGGIEDSAFRLRVK